MRRLLLLLVLPLCARAQETAPPAKDTRALHEIHLRSGSVLVGHIEPRKWKVLTAFGELTVPVDNVRRIRFGTRAQPERLQRIQGLIEDLGSANPERRNHAQAALKEEGGYAAGALEAASKHADPEVRRICGELLDAMELEEDEVIPPDDRVETTLFSVSGAVSLNSFKVRVEELGALDIRRSDVVSIRARGIHTVREFKVTGQDSMTADWVDTGIEVKSDTRLKISAQGSIHFPRWGNQVFTPDGNPNMGVINGLPMGTLVGRVGPGGNLFRLGSSFRGRPQGGQGTLQICILVNVRGQPSTGEYVVEVEIED